MTIMQMLQNRMKKYGMNVRGSLCDFLYESYSLKGRFYFENCPMYTMFYRFLNFYSGCAQGTQEITAQGELLFHEMMADWYHWTIGMEPREKTIAENVKDYIDLHIDEKITVRQLCKNVGLSPAQLNRVFKKLTAVRHISTVYLRNCQKQVHAAAIQAFRSGKFRKNFPLPTNITFHRYFTKKQA